MEVTERRDEEISDGKVSENTDSFKSQYVTESFADERHSRELKAGLHPLRNFALVGLLDIATLSSGPKNSSISDLTLKPVAQRVHIFGNVKYKFMIWYTRRTPGVRSQASYEDNIKKIVEFSSVEGFWACYCHIARSSLLPSPTDLHFFKDGIRPLWEDGANCNGGKWIIRFPKVVSARFWEDLLLALVGDQLDDADNICGAVLSVRFNEDIISVWNRNASDHQAVMGLRDSLKRHLKLPHAYVMEYKPHDASLRDKSSYRNTWLRG